MMRRRTLRDQRGAVLVEAAIVAPFVFMLMFSILWGALVFRTYLTVSQASSSAARAVSIAGTDRTADYEALQAVVRDSVALGDNAIERVVIYRASGFEDPPSEACSTGDGGADCNIYSAADLSRSDTEFGAGDWAGDDNFPSASRNNSASSGTYVGVFVAAKPKANIMSLPAPETISAWKVLRVEPKTF